MRTAGRSQTAYMAAAGLATGFAALVFHQAWSWVFPPLFASRCLTEMWTAVSLLLGVLLGSLYFRSRSRRLRSRPRLFVFMQVALGVAAVLAMQLLSSLAGLPGALDSHGVASGTVSSLIGGLLSFLILFVPAFLLSGILSYGLGHGPFAALLFLGCAIGALNQAFMVAPSAGLWISCLVGAAAVIGTGLMGLVVAGPDGEPESGESGPARMGLGGIGVIGFGAYVLCLIFFAILGTRLILLAAGHTVQASAIAMATLLGGLAAGSAISSGLLRGRVSSLTWLGTAAGLSAVFGLLIGRWASSLPLSFLSLAGNGVPTWHGLLTSYWALALAWLLLPGILLGSALPMVTGSRGERTTAGGPGWGLTAGAAGVLAAVLGACLLPSPNRGLRLLLSLVPWFSVGIAMIMLAASRSGRLGRIIPAACFLIIAGAATLTMPAWNAGIMTAGLYTMPGRFMEMENLEALLSKTDVVVYEESPQVILSVERTPEAITVKANGTARASTAGDGISERLAAHIPLLMHNRPRDLLLLGLGTGARLASARTHPLESIECVEGVRAAGRAARVIASLNLRATGDSRLTMTHADPGYHLLNSNRSYDVIILESPQPYTRYGAGLLTAEFFDLLRSRLNAGGMACQIINTTDLSPESLGSVAKTFAAYFPHVNVWWTGGYDILLAGSMEPALFDAGAIERRMAVTSIGEDLARVNITEPLGILALFMADRETVLSLGAGRPANTVVRNRLAYDWPKRTLDRMRSDAFTSLHRASESPVALMAAMDVDSPEYRLAGERLDSCAGARDLYIRSTEAVAAGNLMEGISLLAEAADACQGNEMLRFQLSDYHMISSRRAMAGGRLEDAVNSARRAIELNPLSPAAFYNLAGIEENRDMATASTLLGKAIDLDPAYIPAYLLKAKLELATGRPGDASETVGRVLTVEPFNPTAHQLKGLSLIQRHQYEGGRSELEKALEGRPGNLDILEAIAYGWLLEGRMDRAGDLYRQVLKADPERLGALNNYATVLAERGEYRRAVEVWTRALGISPGNPDIKANIEEARQKMRR